MGLAQQANISVLILDGRFHGYYIHCKLPNHRADNGQESVLRKKVEVSEGNESSRLGLDGSEELCSGLFVNTAWRKHYDREFRKARSAGGAGASQGSGLNLLALCCGSMFAGADDDVSEQLVKDQCKASSSISTFLRQFLDNQGDFKHDKLKPDRPSSAQVGAALSAIHL